MNHISPYMLHCKECGKVYLTQSEYERQLEDLKATWKCPFCVGECDFNSELLEAYYHCGGQ